MQINDIQKEQLSVNEYENIVLRPKYDVHKEPPCDVDADSTAEKETIIDDEGQTYEVLVIADDFDQKTPVDNEFEEYELLEVDNVDANSDISRLNQSKEIEHSELEDLNEDDKNELSQVEQNCETDELVLLKNKSEKSPRRRSNRISKESEDIELDVENGRRSTQQATKTKRAIKSPEPIEKKTKKSSVASVKRETNTKDKCNMDNMQQDFDDVEGESDDEFPARDSDNEDWPSQETLSVFPKEIIKNGLLTVKGKELMSFICRYALKIIGSHHENTHITTLLIISFHLGSTI